MSKVTDKLAEQTIEDLRRVWELSAQDSGQYRIPLVKLSFGFEEIIEAIDSLLSTRLTMGNKVRAFEEAFADYIGVKHAIMVNSGSSANLIALHVISNPVIEGNMGSGDEVIVPSLTWSTSIFPILDVGATPVLVDSDPQTFNLDPEEVRAAISDRTKAIVAVHLLGNPCDMKEIAEIANEHNLFLIEDSCEAHGAEFNQRKVGGLGDLGTYSFFFSHHISTIEGGMVLTNNHAHAEVAKSLRAHGWIRELDKKEEIASSYPQIDERFLFVNRGFNLRPTEIQGAFGIHQLKKLDEFVKGRRETAKFWSEELGSLDDIFLQQEQEGGLHSWFGYPFVLKETNHNRRRRLIHGLENAGIQTRVIMGGNMAQQPAMGLFAYKTQGLLANAGHIHSAGIFTGVHPDLTEEERHYFVSVINDEVNKTR